MHISWIVLVVSCLLPTSYSQYSSCFDCNFAPSGYIRTPVGSAKEVGYVRCGLLQSDDYLFVDQPYCQSGRCFVRLEENGLEYRGCADPANLPLGVDSNVQCKYQGPGTALWYFCDGHLCNTGQIGEDEEYCGRGSTPAYYTNLLTEASAVDEASSYEENPSEYASTENTYDSVLVNDPSYLPPIPSEEDGSDSGYDSYGQPSEHYTNRAEYTETVYDQPSQSKPEYNQPNSNYQKSGYNQPSNTDSGYNQPEDSKSGYNQPSGTKSDYHGHKSGYNQPSYTKSGYNQPSHSKSGYNQHFENNPSTSYDIGHEPNNYESSAGSNYEPENNGIIHPQFNSNLNLNINHPEDFLRQFGFWYFLMPAYWMHYFRYQPTSRQPDEENVLDEKEYSDNFDYNGYNNVDNDNSYIYGSENQPVEYDYTDNNSSSDEYSNNENNAGYGTSAIDTNYDEYETYNPCQGCADNPSGLYSDITRPGQFIQCGCAVYDGVPCTCCYPFPMTCPSNTVFSDITKTCSRYGTYPEHG